MTRGRCGSLLLQRMKLSFTTPCRFLPAHGQSHEGFLLIQLVHSVALVDRSPHFLPEGGHENGPGWSPPRRTQSGGSVPIAFSRPVGPRRAHLSRLAMFMRLPCPRPPGSASKPKVRYAGRARP
jgi:hypothetical protein